MDNNIKKSIWITIIIAVIVAIGCVASNHWAWAGGFLFGAVWSTVNLALTSNVLKIALLQQNKKNLTAYLLIKFPVLYLLLALVLMYKLVPMYALLLGFCPIFLVMGIMKLTQSFRIKSVSKK